MKRSRVMWYIFASFLAVLLGAVALTGAMYFRQERNAQDNNSFLALDDSKYNTTELKQSNLLLTVAVGYVDFKEGKGLDVEMDFIPSNNLTNPENGAAPRVPVCFTYWDQDRNFPTDSSMPTEDIKISFTGDINWYPFDRYKGELSFYAFTGQTEGDCTDPLPILPAVYGSLQGFTISSEVEPSAINGVNYSYVDIKFTARRTNVSIGFALLLFVVMWCLTVSIVILTAWIWITGRRTELGAISIATALLYALPRIRGGQPGIPSRVGVIADLVGYIWAVVLVSICVISLIVNWIYRKDGKKPKVNKPPSVKLGILPI